MVLESMTKYEVMDELRKDFDCEVKPFYENVLKKRIMPLIYLQSKRLKSSVINLGWVDYKTKRENTFKILKRGNVKGDLPEFASEFVWHHKKCYALFFDNNTEVVFQKHCLDQYADRVLKDKNLQAEKVYTTIRKNLKSGFHIVLPTPSHPYSIYFVAANALFLGDYEDIEGKYRDKTYNWLNTCISLREAHATQNGIIASLSSMQNFVNLIGFDPVREKDKYSFSRGKLLEDNSKKEGLIMYFKNYYMLYQLHKSFGFPFTAFFIDEIEADMAFLKEELSAFQIFVEGLSPYGKKNGIAIRGEIDFKGSNN